MRHACFRCCPFPCRRDSASAGVNVPPSGYLAILFSLNRRRHDLSHVSLPLILQVEDCLPADLAIHVTKQAKPCAKMEVVSNRSDRDSNLPEYYQV